GRQLLPVQRGGESGADHHRQRAPGRRPPQGQARVVHLTPIEPTPEEVQYLEDRIYEHNSGVTGIGDGQWLAVPGRDGSGRIIAGVSGNTWGAVCEIRQLWVDEALRHRGLGTQLLRAVEDEARRRSCSQIVLMTFSFQAPAFYERNGFEVVATIANHPRGHRNLLMRKHLDGGQPPSSPGN